MTPSRTTPQAPGMIGAVSDRTMWHVLVPMIATRVPTSVTVAAGADTWASTLATATAMPGRKPVHPAARSLRRPATSPRRAIERDIFESTTAANWG